MSKREVFVSLNIDLKGAEKLGPLVTRQKELKDSTSALKKEYKVLDQQLKEGNITQLQYQKSVDLNSAAIARNRVELKGLSAIEREATNDLSGLTDANLRFRDKMADANLEALKASGILGKLETAAASTRTDIERLGQEFKTGAITQEQYAKESAQLSGKLEGLQGDITKVNAVMDEGSKDTKKLKEQSEQLTKELQDLATAYASGSISAKQFAAQSKDVTQKLDQTNERIDSFSKGLKGNIEGGIKGALTNFTGYVAGAFALQALVSWGDELRKRGVELEQITGRAKVLFGEGFDAINAKAVENGELIGRSSAEYLQLASVAQDAFTNIGFGTETSAKLSEQLVQTAADLEDFTAGGVSAEQALQILKSAALGNTKGLKELNIPVKANAEDIADMADSIEQSEGVTRAEAEALANLRFTFEAINPKIAEFKKETGDADAAQDKATAQFKESSDTLARQLAPAFTLVTGSLSKYVAGITGLISTQDSAFGKIIAFGAALSSPGSNLLGQQSAEAAKEIKKRTDAVTAYILAQRAYAESIPGLQKRIADLAITEEKRATLFPGQIDAMEAEAATLKASLQLRIDEAVASGRAKRDKDAEGQSIEQLNARLAALKTARESMTDAESLKANAKQQEALTKQIDAIDELGFAADKSSKKTINLAGSVAAIQESISKLQTQQAQSTSSEQFEAYQIQIDTLNQSVDLLTGKITQELLEAAKKVPEKLGTRITRAPLPLSPQGLTPEDESITASKARAADIMAGIRDQSLTEGEIIDRAKLKAGEDFNAGRIKSEEEYLAIIADLNQRDAEQKAVVREATLSAASDLFNNLASLAEEGSAEQKALAITASLINTYQGITAALTLPPPASFIAAAATGVTGFAAVAKIAAFAEGGVVGDRPGIVRHSDGAPISRANGDNRLATVRVGEKYLNTGQQRTLESMVGPDVWRNIGMPSSAQRPLSSLPAFAAGGLVTDVLALPTPSSDQLIAAQQAVAMRNINFRPVVQVSDIRSASSKVDVSESRASLQ